MVGATWFFTARNTNANGGLRVGMVTLRVTPGGTVD